MTPSLPSLRRRVGWLAAAFSAALLAACGGGGSESTDPGGLSCSVTDQQTWLGSYMDDWYFWYATSPKPVPGAYATVDSFFSASLYTGNDANFPVADHWSYRSDTADYQRRFLDGQTLGYGVMVAGLEVAGRPDLPLYVRYVEPGSPAAAAGLARGDQLLTVNGRAVSELIAADDYSALSATATGQTLQLAVRNAAGDRQLSLSATVYNLVPVANTAVVRSPNGRAVGYLMVKDMIDQALSPMDAAFAQFKAAGVQEVVIDLRYNGGGLVSTAAALASFPAGPTTGGQVYASLLYNNKHSNSNQDYLFQRYANATGLSRVYVLTGQRTCSASEQLINGLRPFVNVVTIGDTTCGKPVGFLPQDDGCGSTWSVVNFESVNASNEGRYFDGFNATCPVAEDLSVPLGTTGEPLLAAALSHADTGACPAQAQTRQGLLGWKPAVQRPHFAEPGDRGGLIAR